MGGIILDQLIMMLKSGVPLKEAIELLVNICPNDRVWRRMNEFLRQGKLLTEVAQELFPWWCPYPFSNVDVSIHSISYLESCQEFLNYRLKWFKKASQLLAYPLFLYVFSIFLIILFLNVESFGEQLPQWFILVIIIVFFGITGCILYLLSRIFLITPLDVLDLCRLCFKQGWSLNSLFNSLSFPYNIQIKWQKTKIEMLNLQSFVRAFSLVFRPPLSIESALKMHEQNGQLPAGLDLIIPYYRHVSLSRFRWMCQGIKAVLYLLVVASIFIILHVAYFPMLDQIT